MLTDLRVALRTLAKRRGYLLSIVTTLAVGIGASAMMFSLIDAAFLRPLPFHRADGLVVLTGVAGSDRSPRGGSFPEIADWRTMNGTLDQVSIYDEISLNLRIGSEAVRVDAEMVSASYFPLLGASAVLGRTFTEDEDAVPGRNPVAVVSNQFWRQRLGSDPNVLGRTIQLNDRPLQIVGVMPAGFAGVSFDTDVWVPSMMVSLVSAPSVVQNRGTRWLFALARLDDGVTLARAQDDLTRVAGILESQYPAYNSQRGVQVDPLRQNLVDGAGGAIVSLFAAVLLFLLVACTNVAGLQLARATARRRELAVRLALGAGRWHVLRQLLAESLLVSVAAGVLGSLLAAWSISAALALTPDGALPRYVRPSLDARTLAFAIAVSLAAAVLVALVPAMAVWRRDVGDALKSGARSVEPGLGSIRRPSLQQALVVAEIALAMVLLTSAGLMTRSLQKVIAVPIAFEPSGVTVGQLVLPADRYAAEQRGVFVERLEERLRRVPGATAVAVGSDMPFTGASSAANIVPDVAPTPDATVRHYRHFVTPGYFDALGIAIRKGRAFTMQDRSGAPPVAIINESGARRIWGDGDPIGRRFRLGAADGPQVEIVGVAADARFRSLTGALVGARVEPDVFYPFAQRTDRNIEVAVKTVGPAPSAAVLQQAIADLDRGLPIYQVRPLAEAIRQQTSIPRFTSGLLSLFSGGALLLSSLGLYGLVSYVTTLSRREIAVRLALGASAGRVIRTVLGNGIVLVATGAVVGAAGSILVGRALQTQLYQTSPADPLTFGAVASLLLLVSAVASLLPTRRAVRIDPHSALRD